MNLSLDEHDHHSSRPWCSGRANHNSVVPWFPRLTRPPTSGPRPDLYLHSPPGQLPGLQKEAWFLVHFALLKRTDFAPVPVHECGITPRGIVRALEKKLSRVYAHVAGRSKTR